MRLPPAETREAARAARKNPRTKRQPQLKPLVRARWLREAQEIEANAAFRLLAAAADRSAEDARDASLRELLDAPVVALDTEKVTAKLQQHVESLRAPSRGSQNCDARNKRARRCSRRRIPAIEPLISTEMRDKLQSHLVAKIQGDIWANEIRSRLARPLSASVYCVRDEQLRHPLAAAQFLPDPITSPANPQFPFSIEAHSFVRVIDRCYGKHRFRMSVFEHARRFAMAARVLRLRGIPLLVKGFRWRRRAAVRIQRQFRRYIGWRERVLRPFVTRQVADWTQRGLELAKARYIIAAGVSRLFHKRRERREAVARRVAHLRRWAAKTRVCLFVHQVWIVEWLKRKREANVAASWLELKALETAEHEVHAEFKVLLLTNIGKRMLKQEVTQWRKTGGSSPSVELPAVEGEDPSLARLRQCFHVFDLDGSGTLDLDEFELMLSYLRGKLPRRPGKSVTAAQRKAVLPRLSTTQVRNLFDELDGDGSGSVSLPELERWWGQHLRANAAGAVSSSASASFLSGGLDRLLLQSHGLLFWLLGRRQQLERKFVKKMMVKRAMDAAKLSLLQERLALPDRDTHRCRVCARRFGLGRDLRDHVAHSCDDAAIVVDTFVRRKWIHEDEFRLLDE